jgi:glutamate 5-kinase
VNSNGSLLPAGIVKVTGLFDRGEVVSIVGKNMDRIASGISNYSSNDLEKIHGSQSDQIDRLAGHFYGDEVIHRNNMIIHR